MGIFKENFDSKQSQMNQSMVIGNQTQNKQATGVTAPEQGLQRNKEKESVLSLKGLEQFNSEKFKSEDAAAYKSAESQKDVFTTERESRKRSEVNGTSATELKSMLDEISSNRNMARMVEKEMAKLGLTDDAGADLSEIDAEKLEILKKQAPKVYERLLKFERLRVNLPKEKTEENKKLRNSAMEEMLQSQREWEYVKNMANDVNGSGSGDGE